MEALLWHLRASSSFALAWPLLLLLVTLFLFSYIDFVILLFGWFGRSALGLQDPALRRAPGPTPDALVIIPSLLRGDDDFGAITKTVHSCAINKFAGNLLIVPSVDGTSENPDLVAKLDKWLREHRHPENVRLARAGTVRRAGKMMAVEAAVEFVHRLEKSGELPSFPPVYFSVDGDGVLGEQALQRMVDRLRTPHRLTGRPRRVVAGKCYIRPELFWQGWNRKSFFSYFTLEGQIHRQVAREFLVSNVPRFNLRAKPQVTIPGGLFCTWSDLVLQAPRYMGFLLTIRRSDWLRWWLGGGPPRFSRSHAPPLPEALTGPSDDTCISFLAQMATWKDGRLSLDPPATPWHALGRLLRAYFLERTPGYAPEARVLTYTPSTTKALWTQRVRWNASRFECSFRFRRALAYHWEVAAPMGIQWLFLPSLFRGAFFYILLPFGVFKAGSLGVGFLIGYLTQMGITGLLSVLALIMERQRRKFWPALFALPLTPLYGVFFNVFSGITGVTKDLFLFGNTTKFAPEWTFVKGRTTRIAVLYRLRRFVSLCIRAVIWGDVPFGWFWFGWRETPWTPNGYVGWTTGARPNLLRWRKS
jgi:hypothetical protein